MQFKIGVNSKLNRLLLCLVSWSVFCTLSFGQRSPTDITPKQEQIEAKEAGPQFPKNFGASTVRFPHDQGTYIGRPLIWNGTQMGLIRRNGALNFVDVPQIEKLEVLSPKFQPHTPELVKEELAAEFDSRYEITATDRCVVVHPVGESDYWAQPFEQFIDNFEYFFEQKDFELQDAQFPYIVIILRSRGDFDRYMRSRAEITNRNVTGFYSVLSNRMATYDPVGLLRLPEEERQSWLYDSSTVLHESAHQLAFNRGVHSRLSPPPLWLSEGFAMLFEARGINQAKDFDGLRERANVPRLQSLRNLYRGGRIKGKLEQLITSNQLFRTDPGLAYALSWGIVFYLSEHQPEAFLDYLRYDVRRENFKTQTSNQRAEAFVDHFGADLKKLEEEMKNFYVEKDE